MYLKSMRVSEINPTQIPYAHIYQCLLGEMQDIFLINMFDITGPDILHRSRPLLTLDNH